MRQAVPHPASDARSGAAGDFWRGFQAGLIPLILLIILVALTVMGVTLARVLAIPLGFLTWQWIVAGVWAGGLLISAVVYGVATVRALRRVSVWQSAGLTSQVMGAYWALGIAALVVLLPIILALAMPQHPA